MMKRYSKAKAAQEGGADIAGASQRLPRCSCGAQGASARVPGRHAAHALASHALLPCLTPTRGQPPAAPTLAPSTRRT